MSTMEHFCVATLDNGKQCDFFVLDNTRRGQPCPIHGDDYMSHHCDEEPDYNDSRDERDDIEEDDDG